MCHDSPPPLGRTPLQDVRHQASRVACFLIRLGNGTVRDCAQCLEGDGPQYVAGEQADVEPLPPWAGCAEKIGST